MQRGMRDCGKSEKIRNIINERRSGEIKREGLAGKEGRRLGCHQFEKRKKYNFSKILTERTSEHQKRGCTWVTRKEKEPLKGFSKFIHRAYASARLRKKERASNGDAGRGGRFAAGVEERYRETGS